VPDHARILVAVDFSEPARAAFDRAIAIARARGAELTAVHAVPVDQPFNERASARIALFARLRQAAQSAGVPFRVSVQHGNPAGVILLHARARRPDLIVIGTHGRTGRARRRDGAIAERVALGATAPVFVVPALRGASPDRPLERIVVGVDFGKASTRALEHALALPRRASTRVTVVHAVPGFAPARVPRYLYRYGVPEFQGLQAKEARARMEEVLRRAAATPAPIDLQVVTGDPAAEIARAASTVDADLIVLGITRRGALSRRIVGATASRVMQLAGRHPILVVPEPAAGAASEADALARSLAA
jgi:nucleotide-binding universal stress UspA family protein